MARKQKEQTKLERLDIAISEIANTKAGLYRKEVGTTKLQDELSSMIDGLCKVRAILMQDEWE